MKPVKERLLLLQPPPSNPLESNKQYSWWKQHWLTRKWQRSERHQTDAANCHLRCETSTRRHCVSTAPLPAHSSSAAAWWLERVAPPAGLLSKSSKFQDFFLSFFFYATITYASCQRSVCLNSPQTPSSSTHVLYSTTPTLNADSLPPSGFTSSNFLFCRGSCLFFGVFFRFIFTVRGLQKMPAPCGVIYESCGEVVQKTHCGFIHF